MERVETHEYIKVVLGTIRSPLYFLSLPFLQNSLPHIVFSLPDVNISLQPPNFFLPILFSRARTASERVPYSAVTYNLSVCIYVHCNRPIPAHPPTHPARHPTTTRPRPARHPPHPAPPGPQPQPPTPPDPASPPTGPTRPAPINRRRGRHRGMIGA